MKPVARFTALALTTLIPVIGHAQATETELATLRLLAVPITALPPDCRAKP